jgi:hypothetical protein
VVLPFTISVKEPTAYIVPPHCTSWRICCAGLSAVVFRCGVLDAGTAETAPDGGDTPPVPAAAKAPVNKTRKPATAGISSLDGRITSSSDHVRWPAMRSPSSGEF